MATLDKPGGGGGYFNPSIEMLARIRLLDSRIDGVVQHLGTVLTQFNKTLESVLQHVKNLGETNV